MIRRWLAREKWGLLVGLGLTGLAVVLHIRGVTRPIEFLGFDYLVRYFSRIQPDDQILHIDIDDDALERVGKWPWSREIQAELVRLLSDLGADRIVMDFLWVELEGPEFRHPWLDPYADLEGEIKVVGELTEENIVYPDEELANAIAEAGNVHMAMFYEPAGHAEGQSRLEVEIAGLLRAEYGLTADDLAVRLGRPVAEIEEVLAGLKRRVAEELVGGLLAADPGLSLQEVHSAILDKPFDEQTADREDVLAAYVRELGLRELREKLPAVPAGLKGKLPTADRIEPPVYKISSSAHAIGFVTFEPDFDGRTRHLPLMLEWEGRLIEQLAMTVAREMLDIRLEELTLDSSGALVIPARGDRRALRVQLDEKGQMLVNWYARPERWEDCFAHVPVTRLLCLYDCRERMQENEVRRQLAVAEAMRLVKDQAGFDLYRDQYRAMLASERRVKLGKLRGQAGTEALVEAEAEARRLRQVVMDDQRETLRLITEGWSELAAEPDPNDPEIADEYRRFKAANELVTGRVSALEQANKEIDRQRLKWVEELRPLVEGRVCFVGHTGTAVADVAASPAYRWMPGVLVHSNTLNSFLQGQFRSWSGTAVQIALILAFGAAITLVATIRGPKVSFFALVILLMLSVASNAWVLFERLDYWLGMVTALGLTFVVWAMIVLLHYLTVDRQKRHLRNAVAQYVSPAMARRIGESAGQIDLSPVSRDLTCFFSDLKGFTPISERLGPEGTKTVLNPYLEAMSVTLHRHEALINKFMGDGVFAFFNPPILPVKDHEVAGCEAALACREALRDLAARHAGHHLASEFRGLVMRVGLASGRVFVGDYGSENKLDYTCMGDTVNLAARLESANKQFGTSILLTEGIRHKAGDRYVFRWLGRVQVIGQRGGAGVYELLGRRGDVAEDELGFAELFGEAVAAFACRDWVRARRGFERCLESKADDPGSVRYLGALCRYEAEEPPDDWAGALELAEK